MVLGNARRAWYKIPQIGGKYYKTGAQLEKMMPIRVFICSLSPQTATCKNENLKAMSCFKQGER